MAHVRHTVKIPLSVSRYPSLAKVSKDGDSHKVMVFCANDGQGAQDITFPHQSEIKVNGGDVKANLRGLKNKPGSTRPVDISTYLRYTPEQYSNTVEMTFALTNKAGAIHVSKRSPSISLHCPAILNLLRRTF
jgi:E3 SUMO-protein ligase PIAS1